MADLGLSTDQSPNITPDLSTVPSITPGQTPLLTNLPSSITAFNRKYSDPQLQQLLAGVSPTIRQSIINYDQSRVNRGQEPLSASQTLLALQSATTNQPATPPESQGFFGRTLGDLQNLVSEIPHLPFTLYHEAQQLPSAPSKLQEVLGRGNIQDIIGGLREVPGLRMVPGVFTASQLANEGPSGLTEHPLFTLLDVLPYAKPGVNALAESTLSRLPRVTEARAALADTLPVLNEARTAAALPELPEPSSLRLAARTSPTLQRLASTRPIQALQGAFGTSIRDLVQMYQATASKGQARLNPEAPPEIHTPETEFIRTALSDIKEWNNIPKERVDELTQRLAINKDEVLADPSLSDPERAFVDQLAEHTDAFANASLQRKWLGTVDGELFTPSQANRILTWRKNVNRYQVFNDTRNLIASAGEQGIDAINSLDTSRLVSEQLSIQDKFKLARGYAHVIDAAGYDSSRILDTIRVAEKYNTPLTIDNVRAAIDSFKSAPVARPIIPPEQILSDLQPFVGKLGGPGDPTIAQARAFVRAGQYQSAIEKLRSVSDRSTHLIPGVDDMLESLRRMRDQNKYLESTSRFDDKALAKVQQISTRLEQRTVPARFVPIIQSQVRDKLLEMFVDDPEATRLINEGFYQLVPGLDPSELNKLQVGVASTWKALRDDGYNPIFIHSVSPSRLNSLTRPVISDTIRTPTQVRERTLDATPSIPNASVALTDMAREFVSRLGQEEFTNHVESIYGQRGIDVLRQTLPAARELAGEDVASTAGHAQTLIQRDWEQYDPLNPVVPESQVILKTYDPNATYIPKPVANTLRKLFHEHEYKIQAVFDPIMKVFRTSILPLSPRWHVGNIAGGATILALSTDPSIFIRYFGEAVKMAKSGDLHLIPGMPPAGFGTISPEIVEWNKTASLADKVVAGWQWKGGATIRRLWDSSAPLRDKANSIIDNSYKFNGFIDDLYRSMAYLYGKDHALTKGLTPAQAERAGVALVRKILPEWDRITPFERQVMRFVFPFYTWAQFILKHAYRYPADHPYRAAVTASLARQEMEDFGGALPTRFMDAIFLGNPDASGNLTALQTSSLNPFRDVANYFTLAGFTRSSNPIIATVLESLGVNPSQGAQDLYPDIAYDPETGQLRPSNPSLLSSFIGNVIPQSQLLTAMVGHNQRFQQILRTNPDAAAAMLRSSFGLPNLFRSINPATEIFKAEVQRENLQSQVKSEALRSGDWSRAQNFPQLQAYFQQVATLMNRNPAIFKQYVPTTQSPSPLDTLRTGLVTMNLP